MTQKRASPGQRGAADHEADTVLAACRVLVAISAQSIAAVEDVVDLVEFRALVIVASRGPMSLSELAGAASIHLTRASRLCDRLVVKDLLNRTDDPANRRQLTLTLTAQGEQIVHQVMGRRRQAIQPILERMSTQMSKKRRAEVVTLLQEFATAGGEPSDSDLWAMGWTT